MNGIKVVSVVLAVVLVAYSGVSAALLHKLRAGIRDADSKCKALDSRCKQLESKRDELANQLAEARPLGQFRPASSDDDAIARLQEILAFKETELADLSKAYESLRAEHDALVAQMSDVDLPPEAVEMIGRLRQRFGSRPFSPEARDQRREEFVQRVLAELQERVNQLPDDRIQQSLTRIAESVSTIDELRRQLMETTDDDQRRELGLALRDGFRDLQRMVRDERNLELAYVAGQFGIDDPENVRRFVRAVESVNNNPAQRLLQPFGTVLGGRRFREQRNADYE